MPSEPRRRKKRSLRRRLLNIVLMVAITAVFVPALLGVGSTILLVYPACDEHATTPADFGLVYEDITLSARAGGEFRAFFIPGTNDATIIIAPTTTRGRGTRLNLAAMFANHGYAVVTFESRRCAHMGPISLGYKETDEVGDVLDYLLARGDINLDRIGITGFSSAGATSIMAAARFPEIAAVAAEGGYDDFATSSISLGTGGFLELIYKWSIAASYYVILGMNINKLSPLDMIPSIAPRPILLIYGSKETTLAGAYRQQAAAGDNAELWVVPDAFHGEYWRKAGDEYEQRLIAFFDRALLGDKID